MNLDIEVFPENLNCITDAIFCFDEIEYLYVPRVGEYVCISGVCLKVTVVRYHQPVGIDTINDITLEAETDDSDLEVLFNLEMTVGWKNKGWSDILNKIKEMRDPQYHATIDEILKFEKNANRFLTKRRREKMKDQHEKIR